MINVQIRPSDADRMLKAFGSVVIVALYKRAYNGEASMGVKLSREVTSANNLPTSSLATTEAITDLDMGDFIHLNRDKTIAEGESP